MNMYLVALIGLAAVFAVGYVMYGMVFKNALKDVPMHSPVHIGLTTIGFYLLALAFIELFGKVSFAAGTDPVLKGLYLGLFIGVPFLALPLYFDGSFLKAKPAALQAVIINWIISFIVLGIVVGFLAK